MTSPRVSGLLLVDKAAGGTSHDVVAVARRALGERSVGHAGTLDPFATGLLVLLVGDATRLLPYLEHEPKVYRAAIAFGSETSTDDVTGTITREAALPEADAVERGIASLTGLLMQTPPAISAKQRGGRRAYAAARSGAPLELTAAPVRVDGWQVETRSPQGVTATIVCGAGTYVRALARDLGRLAGSAAHLKALRRLASGPLRVENAISSEALTTLARDALRARIISPLGSLAPIARRQLSADEVRAVRQGRPISAAESGGARAVLLSENDAIVAVAERLADQWHPRAVFSAGG